MINVYIISVERPAEERPFKRRRDEFKGNIKMNLKGI
jgi:hypothetical protein